MKNVARRDNATSELERETRLGQIRERAERGERLQVVDNPPAGAPFPQASAENGYYRLPLLKTPPWTWEVPLYFFVGGAAGAAAVIGAIANYTGADRELVRHARWVAAAGSVISPALLISDLGRPERFLSMLRVFKPQSPMSVGVWTLVGFSTAAAAVAFADYMKDNYGASTPVRVLENAGQAASLALGLPFSNYTGVLIGASVIPVWNENAGTLPLHFGASGLGAAVGILELLGDRKSRALQALGLGSAIFEMIVGARIELGSRQSLKPLKSGSSGWVTRAGGALAGPLPIVLRTASLFSSRRKARTLRQWASWSSIAGSLITRIAWIHAGRSSARDWRQPLQLKATSDPNEDSQATRSVRAVTSDSRAQFAQQ